MYTPSEIVFKALQANPFDEVSWQAFADTLEENGDVAMATQTRQIRYDLATRDRIMDILRLDALSSFDCHEALVQPGSDRREFEILKKYHVYQWRRYRPFRLFIYSRGLDPIVLPREYELLVRGPFIVGIHGPYLLNTVGLIPLLRKHPIGYVRPTDRFPQSWVGKNEEVFWISGKNISHEYLSEELIREMPHGKIVDSPVLRASFPNQDAAVWALSEATIKVGRSKANVT